VSLSIRFVVLFFKTITTLICRIDSAGSERVPAHGPLIIYTNHVNVLEIPIIFTRLQPRKMHGMVLAERWNIPVLSWMLDVAQTIPLHRAEADIGAIRKGLEVLKRGEMIIISPEGTRSHDGKLQAAHPGVVLLALHSQAPLLPVAYHGAENWKVNIKNLRRTDFHMEFGHPFHLETRGEKVTHTVREKMMDEMMVQLARLLPTEYRGYYARAPAEGEKYLEFV